VTALVTGTIKNLFQNIFIPSLSKEGAELMQFHCMKVKSDVTEKLKRNGGSISFQPTKCSACEIF
jgi:recombinational DNA repair protein RecR